MFRLEYKDNVSTPWVALFLSGSGDYETREEAEAYLKRTGRDDANHYRATALDVKSATAPEKQDSKIAFAAKKVPLMFIAMQAIYGVARVFGYGRKKHGAGNYLLASLSDGAGERYMGALLRHASEMQNLNGTWDAKSLAALDEESGLPHLDHMIATLIMLRGILIKDGVLPLDPGEGNEPPTKVAQ